MRIASGLIVRTSAATEPQTHSILSKRETSFATERIMTGASCLDHLTVHGRQGDDVPGVGGQREHVQLVVANQAALAVPKG